MHGAFMNEVMEGVREGGGEYDLPVLGTLLRSFGLYFSCWH